MLERKGEWRRWWTGGRAGKGEGRGVKEGGGPGVRVEGEYNLACSFVFIYVSFVCRPLTCLLSPGEKRRKEKDI